MFYEALQMRKTGKDMKIPLFETDKKICLGLSCNIIAQRKKLTRASDPWVDHVDEIIVVEGRYRIPYSPEMMKQPIPPKFGPNTFQILNSHYRNKLSYYEYYGLQTDKRQKYLDVAQAHYCDALIVFDTDEVLINTETADNTPRPKDWNRFYKRIALAHEFLEGEPGILDMWSWIPDEETWSRQHNKAVSNTWQKWHRIHLNPGKQKYILNHYTLSYLDTTEQQILEWSSKEENFRKWNPHLIYPMGTAEGIRFTMDRKLRDQDTNTFSHNLAWQLIQEELYRAYLIELQATDRQKVYDEIYREPFTYWFNESGRPIDYTKEEQELFNSLEL